MDAQYLKCPRGHTDLTKKTELKKTEFRNTQIEYQFETYICEKCGIAVGTINQTAQAQLEIAEAYRKKTGLLTSAEIKAFRRQFNWTQQKLSHVTGLGLSSIKRWELGIIQSGPMDRLLREAFRGDNVGNYYTGNRNFSLERIKLVMKEFEKVLGFKFLEEGDMMLFDAKYAWFADMVAHRDLGRSMTGAAYGALPHGPQLNNYRDLIDIIRDADETKAEPLSEDEKKIIAKIAKTFPTKQMVFDASHREPAWKDKTVGAIISYRDSDQIEGIK